MAGTITAMLGLSLMFAAYWLIRDLDGAVLASGYLKIALGLGSMFLVFGVIALIVRPDPSIPTGYFIATSCLCLLGFVKFRAYRNQK